MSTRTNLKSKSWLLVLSILLGIVGLFAFAASKFTPGKVVVTND